MTFPPARRSPRQAFRRFYATHDHPGSGADRPGQRRRLASQRAGRLRHDRGSRTPQGRHPVLLGALPHAVLPQPAHRDYDKFFVTLEEPELAPISPIFKAALDNRVALVFPFGEENGRHYHNSCLVTDKNGKRLGIYRKTHIPAILPSNLPGGTGSYEKF